jgi:hypothetical protein
VFDVGKKQFPEIQSAFEEQRSPLRFNPRLDGTELEAVINGLTFEASTVSSVAAGFLFDELISTELEATAASGAARRRPLIKE